MSAVMRRPSRRPARAWALLAAVAVAACAGTPVPRQAPTAPPARDSTPGASRSAWPPTAAPARAASCVSPARWSTRRLAAQTVIVPAQQTDVGSVAREVSRGAGGVILFGSEAPANLRTELAALR